MTKVFLILMQFHYSESFFSKELIGFDYEYFLSDNFAFSCEGSYSGGFAGISYINKNYCFNFSVIGNHNHIKCLIGSINIYGKFLGYFNINHSESLKNKKLEYDIGIKLNIQTYIYKNNNLYFHFKAKIDKKIFKFNKQKNSYVDENDLSFNNELNVASMVSEHPVIDIILHDHVNNENTMEQKKETDKFAFSFKSEGEDDLSNLSVSEQIRFSEIYNFSSENSEKSENSENRFKEQSELFNLFISEEENIDSSEESTECELSNPSSAKINRNELEHNCLHSEQCFGPNSFISNKILSKDIQFYEGYFPVYDFSSIQVEGNSFVLSLAPVCNFEYTDNPNVVILNSF